MSIIKKLIRRLHRHRICSITTTYYGDKNFKEIKPSIYTRITGKPIVISKDECIDWIKDMDKYEEKVPYWERK